MITSGLKASVWSDLSNGVIQKQPIRDPGFDSSLENSLIQQLEAKIQGPSVTGRHLIYQSLILLENKYHRFRPNFIGVGSLQGLFELIGSWTKTLGRPPEYVFGIV